MSSFEFDGEIVAFAPGETVLDAARRSGGEIPTLCFSPGLPPEGGCRLCLVEIEGHERPEAACTTPLEPGMRVRSASPRLDRLRRGLLDLALSELPEDEMRADPESPHVLERELARHQIARSSFGGAGARTPRDRSLPFLRFDAARCILCRRCLHACEEVQGQFVYGIEGRGGRARLALSPGPSLAESRCVECGACVDVCPSGALSDADRERAVRAQARVESTCGYCGVGCRVRIWTRAGRVERIEGVPQAPVNRGHLCAKGRFAHGWQRSPERLVRPLLRGPSGLEAVGWDHAISWLAGRLRELLARHGPQALAALSSSRSTNEAAYLLQKLFRAVLGSNNVDCCARVCHSSTALALQRSTGAGAASASYADIERARCIVVAGANPTEAHPVIGARIKQAARRGAALVVIDPRRIELCDYAAVHLQLHPGTNVALQNALARLLLERGACDRAYLDARTEGLAELRLALARGSLARDAAISGVPEPALRAAAELLARGPALFVHGLGLSELAQGVGSVIALCNLALLTGSVGRAGAGLLPLRGQNNVQGNADMGGMPDRFPGYQPLDDPAARARIASLWGSLPPAQPGLTSQEMLAAAREGRLRALWIQGEDVAHSDPDQTRVLRSLESLELCVVQDPFPNETTRFAHLVLPSAGVLEQDGSFTNAERRIQRVRAAVPAPGEARADWIVIRDVARALGADWAYEHPGQVMDEIARCAPALFGGVSYARLEPDGLQWPCPDPAHAGSPTVHAGRFLRGRARLIPVEQVASPESEVAGYPYGLITGRVLEHYNVGTMTRRTPAARRAHCDLLEIHPDDARREGFEPGSRVRVASRWGACEVAILPSERVARGELFLSFHFPETHANRVVGPAADPESRCPQYKLTAVRLERIGGG